MPRVLLVPGALEDLERIQDFLGEHQPARAAAALEVILDALSILERHPAIGRPVDGALRELVISFGATGYVALYRVRPSGTVEVLAVRHQSEAGYG
jgi:plasmid stabilization system protein ParE